MAINVKKSKPSGKKQSVKQIALALLKAGITDRKNWSISHWETYHQCPRLYLFRRVMKLPEPPPTTDVFAHGERVHKDMEIFLKGGPKIALPKTLAPLAKQITHAKKHGAKAEMRWAFNAQFKPTEYFASDAWLRVIADTHWIEGRDMMVADLKTGKPKEWHDTQIHLYSMSGMLSYPKTRSSTAHIWYADHPNACAEVEYKRSNLPAMIKDWKKESHIMLTDKLCSPKPGRYCDWCPFAKSKDGPCPLG